MVDQSKEEYISSYISKLLRKNFGKGPQTCRTTIAKKHIVAYIRGFLTPMEEILFNHGQQKYVDHARKVIVNHLINELKGVIQVTCEVEIKEYYHDWNFPNNSGVVIFVLEEETGLEGLVTKFDVDVQSLESEVGLISALVEKTPDSIYTYCVSPSIYLVERIGILVPIEKALIAKGFHEELLYTKDELEKKYFHRDSRFEAIFKNEVRDIFVDWNFNEDKAMLAFVLRGGK